MNQKKLNQEPIDERSIPTYDKNNTSREDKSNIIKFFRNKKIIIPIALAIVIPIIAIVVILNKNIATKDVLNESNNYEKGSLSNSGENLTEDGKNVYKSFDQEAVTAQSEERGQADIEGRSGQGINGQKTDEQESNSQSIGGGETDTLEANNQDTTGVNQEEIQKLINQADLLAKGYDYDKAIDTLKSYNGDYTKVNTLVTKIEEYEETQKTLDPFGAYDSVDQISHLFFHTLVADNAKAFDNDYKANGYNYYMTTIPEFKEMLQQLYNKGYVLVSIHDVAKKVKTKDGKEVFEPGDILLPKDKKPFVLSQDDVNYYAYMTGDGFASKMVLDDTGRPSTEMVLEDGTVSVGDYDLVPILETFISEHPDFSYRGAKGIIALTGYEGTLGYRTNDPTSSTYKKDIKTVKKVVKAMKEWGWEFASHSYGHRDMQKATYSFTKKDTDRWMKEVASLTGPTDIYIFPFGIDMETTLGHYSSDKFEYLKKLGFDYFCGVYKEPWIQVKKDYVRMTRRPLDGQAMLQFPERLSDLFDLKKVIDPDRPALK